MNFVFLAGLGNSEPGHWQAIWYRSMPGARWVEHADWDAPNATDWVADLDGELRNVPGPKVIVAHSLGCLLAVEWARRHHDSQVKGSFLVAPPDVRAPTFPRGAVGFEPPGGDARPPLPAIVVASTDDPYASLESARTAATVWGAELASVGARGHINLASDIGAWDEGRALFDRFVAGLGSS
jgi:predicted alpha/beta hydrolase family esterase